MDTSKIEIGNKAPKEFNVVIEITANQIPVKYEVDKESGALILDRVVGTSMFYPAHYGFIPNTLGGDGDPLDVLLVASFPVLPCSVIKCRPIGVIKMTDEKGSDEKILCVPVNKVTPLYSNVVTYKDLPTILIDQIIHFFEHYKDLEKDKWVKVEGMFGIEEAERLIVESIENAK